jgi:hypothetical protein
LFVFWYHSPNFLDTARKLRNHCTMLVANAQSRKGDDIGLPTSLTDLGMTGSRDGKCAD